jgi:alpha-beta hydrolase superfamily lysophospholipase
MKESSFEGVGGLRIATRSWRPDGTPRAVMILIHGFNAHSAYMTWPAEQLAARRIACHALDLRGRGKSEGERFYVEKFSDWLGDVDRLVRQARSENPGLPVFVLGHSAGGVIAASYVFEHQDEVAGLISESFAYDVGVPDAAALLLKGISHLVPHLHVYTLKNEIFSRDPAAVARMNSDPLIERESQPAETSAEMLRAADRLTENFPKFTVPVLILHGTADKATRPAGSRRFHDLAGSKDKTLKLYEGHFHDLLNDVDKEIVMADILAWIDARLPRPTVQPPVASAETGRRAAPPKA